MRFNRRDFLRLGGAAFGSAAMVRLLAACGVQVPQESIPNPTATSAPAATALPNATAAPSTGEPAAAPTATAIPYPDLVVARGGEPEALVRAALAGLGGMSRFVRSGSNVLIKPNICVAYHTYEFAATTNPWVVAALVKLCWEAGAASVRVTDFGFGGTQQACYAISGIQEQVQAVGGTMVLTPSWKYETTAIPNGTRLKKVNLVDEVRKADTIINVPIAKVHGLSRLTLAIKNLMGVILDREELHPHLGENIVDLATLVRPTLNVVDAVRIMVSSGPTGGSLDDVKKMDTVIATPDIVAADSYAASLFGLQPDDLGYVKLAAQRGLGRSDLANLRIEEIPVGG